MHTHARQNHWPASLARTPGKCSKYVDDDDDYDNDEYDDDDDDADDDGDDGDDGD